MTTDLFTSPWPWLLAVVVLLSAIVWWQRRRAGSPLPAERSDALDTVADWPPTAAPLLNPGERQAFELLRRALPEQRVLAQVPLSRFLRVPTRQSYARWMGRVGQLCADLLVCSPAMEVLAVIELQPAQPSARAQQRLARMQRVLKAAGVKVLIWPEGRLPAIESVREVLDLPPPPDGFAQRSGPPSFAPTGEDDRFVPNPPDARPSTWFDDFDEAPQPPKR